MCMCVSTFLSAQPIELEKRKSPLFQLLADVWDFWARKIWPLISIHDSTAAESQSESITAVINHFEKITKTEHFYSDR